MAEIRWIPEPEFTTANYAEHAYVGAYELVAFDLPAHRGSPRIIGWELFTGPDLYDLVDNCNAASFDAAKAAAEAAYRVLEN